MSKKQELFFFYASVVIAADADHLQQKVFDFCNLVESGKLQQNKVTENTALVFKSTESRNPLSRDTFFDLRKKEQVIFRADVNKISIIQQGKVNVDSIIIAELAEKLLQHMQAFPLQAVGVNLNALIPGKTNDFRQHLLKYSPEFMQGSFIGGGINLKWKTDMCNINLATQADARIEMDGEPEEGVLLNLNFHKESNNIKSLIDHCHNIKKFAGEMSTMANILNGVLHG